MVLEFCCLFFQTSWGVGVLKSAIFNIFHNRVEFSTILEDLRNFGGNWTPPNPPPRYAIVYDWKMRSARVVSQWWCNEGKCNADIEVLGEVLGWGHRHFPCQERDVRKCYKMRWTCTTWRQQEGAASDDHVTGAKWPAHCKTTIGGTDCWRKQLTWWESSEV